jgi:hypothetical protein
MLLNEVDKEITSSDLEALETFADRIFGKVGIDVEFTRHFLDRVNDERNGKQITASELTRLFKQEYKKWGKPIAQMGPDAEAVMKDLATDINVPFALRWDNKNKELDLIAKTVMRKPNFKTSNREFAIEKNPHRDMHNALSSEENRDIDIQRQEEVDEELNEFWPAVGALAAAGYGLYKGGKAVGNWLGKKRTATADMLPGDGLVKQAGVAVQNRKNQMNKNLAALKNEEAMSAEEIGKYPDLGWTNVNDTQEVKTYLNNMPHTPRVKIETFRQRVTEPQFQKFLKKYMTDHPDAPGTTYDFKFYADDSVDSKPVTTNAPVKGHHNEDAVSDQVKGSDPMPKAKPGRTDHPFIGKLVGSKYDEEVVNEESGISKFNKEDPNNPEVMIQGYGSLMLNQIEDDLVRNFNSLTNMAEKKDWDNIDYQLNKTRVIQAKLEAILNTKEQLQAIRRKGGPKSRGIANESRTSLYDALIEDDGMNEGMFDKLKIMRYKKAYVHAAAVLHKMLQRKYKENEGNRRHSFSYYVAKIAGGFENVNSKLLNDYYLENYKSAFITETGGVGRVVQGVNTSVDVGPGEIKKQAAKFGNVVDKDGVPKKTFR